jgi:hypothetical protein
MDPPSLSLSTAATNISANLTNLRCVGEELGKYQATGTKDKTLDTLRAFVSCPPSEGLTNLMDDIIGSHSDEQLRQLAFHLMNAVLLPNKCIPTCIQLCYLDPCN